MELELSKRWSRPATDRWFTVETAKDLRDAMETLQVHFSEFGEYWGEEQDINNNDA